VIFFLGGPTQSALRIVRQCRLLRNFKGVQGEPCTGVQGEPCTGVQGEPCTGVQSEPCATRCVVIEM
jgi:hypothetical protein